MRHTIHQSVRRFADIAVSLALLVFAAWPALAGGSAPGGPQPTAETASPPFSPAHTFPKSATGFPK